MIPFVNMELLCAESGDTILNYWQKSECLISKGAKSNITAMTYAGLMENFSYDLDGLPTEASGFTINRNAANGLPESVSGHGLNINRGFNGYGEITAQAAM